jgi:ferritin
VIPPVPALSCSLYSTYFRKQSDEERGHCLQFLDFLSKRGGTSIIKPNMLTEPPTDFQSPLHAMEIYLAHERSVVSGRLLCRYNV